MVNNLKTQGRSNGSVGWDWYHDANNMLQLWEYELNYLEKCF